MTKQEKTALNMARFIRSQTLTLLEKLNELDADEHARLLERCEGKQLAVWMRRVCLGEPVARSGKLPTLAPPLL
ncbi:Rop family plasmid primer RNA-binding protein, partial [Escherichia coli]|uniref:Rop family plasmid primer RNA-binding protein n=1 Tax=Escherichia coli TaxID=562 RepID=UPI003EDF1023